MCLFTHIREGKTEEGERNREKRKREERGEKRERREDRKENLAQFQRRSAQAFLSLAFLSLAKSQCNPSTSNSWPEERNTW